MPGIRRHQLDERGMLHVDAGGRTVVRMPADLFGGNGAVAEIEITRGDLNQVLLNAVFAAQPESPCVEYRYAEHIRDLGEHSGGVQVDLASGTTEEFDLLIGADGLHSTTRRLAFGPEEQFSTYLGAYTSYFTVPTPAGTEPHWMTMYLMPGGTAVGLRPDADPATSKALVTIRCAADSTLRRDPTAQRELIRARLAAGGWVTTAISEALDEAGDFYFDELARITMPGWTTDRIALVGDAGYCGSPLSGQGTALALLGAYVLAGEIARTPEEPGAALARYTEALRPFVATAQQLPPGGVKSMAPRTRIGIRAVRASVRLMIARVVQPLMTRMLSETEDFELPEYPTDRADIGEHLPSEVRHTD